MQTIELAKEKLENLLVKIEQCLKEENLSHYELGSPAFTKKSKGSQQFLSLTVNIKLVNNRLAE